MAKSEMSPLERAARALCSLDGHPENAVMDGKRLWEDYLPEARAAAAAIAGPSLDLSREILFRWVGLVDRTVGWRDCEDGELFERAKASLYPDGDIDADFQIRRAAAGR